MANPANARKRVASWKIFGLCILNESDHVTALGVFNEKLGNWDENGGEEAAEE